MDCIEEMAGELLDNFTHTQIFRTRTEMEVSVLNDMKHPTADSKYWQAMREQSVMYNELVTLSYEYRKECIEVRKIERDMKSETDDLEKELYQVEKEQKEFSLKNMERVAKDRIRELKNWHEIKEALYPHMKYGTEDVNEHQLTSYAKRFTNQRVAMGSSGSPSERQNLLGQLETAKVALAKGGEQELLDEINSVTK